MREIVLVTGGSRSGKSLFAETLCRQRGEKIAYLATAEPFDEEMRDRIEKHRLQRPSNWETIEVYRELSFARKALQGQDTLLLDCLTVYVGNLLYHSGLDLMQAQRGEIDLLEAKILRDVEDFICESREKDLRLILVSDELGMGIVPDTRLSRVYRDILGRVNQKAAVLADEVYFVVSGIPLCLKERLV